MSTAPLVSIALPLFNSQHTIAACIDSILLQTYENWELIILDDGSVDASADVSKTFVDPRIRLISDKTNRGISARLNQAIDLAKGEYFARMDSDDIAFPERLKKQVAFMRAHPEIDLLGTGVLCYRGDGTLLGRLPVRQVHEEITARPWMGFYLPHPTWMGRIQWFRRHRYRSYADKAEDQHLLFRTFRTSRFACLPDILLGYREEPRRIKKMLLARYVFFKVLWQEAVANRDYAIAAKLAGIFPVKVAGDIINILMGIERARNVLLPVDENLATAWSRLLKRIGEISGA